jgi:hypothetical protein
MGMVVHYLESVDRELAIELFKMVGGHCEELVVELFVLLRKLPEDRGIVFLHGASD